MPSSNILRIMSAFTICGVLALLGSSCVSTRSPGGTESRSNAKATKTYWDQLLLIEREEGLCWRVPDYSASHADKRDYSIVGVAEAEVETLFNMGLAQSTANAAILQFEHVVTATRAISTHLVDPELLSYAVRYADWCSRYAAMLKDAEKALSEAVSICEATKTALGGLTSRLQAIVDMLPRSISKGVSIPVGRELNDKATEIDEKLRSIMALKTDLLAERRKLKTQAHALRGQFETRYGVTFASELRSDATAPRVVEHNLTLTSQGFSPGPAVLHCKVRNGGKAGRITVVPQHVVSGQRLCAPKTVDVPELAEVSIEFSVGFDDLLFPLALSYDINAASP